MRLMVLIAFFHFSTFLGLFSLEPDTRLTQQLSALRSFVEEPGKQSTEKQEDRTPGPGRGCVKLIMTNDNSSKPVVRGKG